MWFTLVYYKKQQLQRCHNDLKHSKDIICCNMNPYRAQNMDIYKKCFKVCQINPKTIIQTHSYHISASSRIWKNTALLCPISNESEGRLPNWIWDADALYFCLYSTSTRIITNLSSSLTCNAQSLKCQNVMSWQM